MESKQNEFDSTNVFLFIIRWWKHLAIVCFIAALGGVIFSSPWFITPKFQSTVTMFPATSSSLSRSVLAGPFTARQDFLQYGDVEEAERLLQVLESANIRDRVVGRFNLMTHYDIPENSPFRHTALNQIYRSNISFRRTQYGAVEINVRDKDPVMAADIANEIAALVDTVLNDIRFERAELAFEIARSQYLEMLEQVASVEDSLRRVMEMGAINIEAQATMFTRQLARDLSENNISGIRAIEERLDLLGQHGGALIFHSSYLRFLSDNLVNVQRRFHEARTDMENFVSFSFIIDRAYVSEKKIYPVRWLIVFLATFGAGFMGVMSLMVYENLLQKGIIRTRAERKNQS